MEEFGRRTLPDDVHHQILQFLTTKSLDRFQYICKQWSSWFLQKPVLLLYSRRISVNDTFRSCTYYHDIEFSSQHFDEDEKSNTNILFNTVRTYDFGSILICMNYLCFQDGEHIRLYNLIGGNHRRTHTLPLLKFRQKHFTEQIGFGRANTTEEFKVIQIHQRQCYVCTVQWRRKKWREVAEAPFYVGGSSAFVNGSIHFLPAFPEQPHKSIAKFDLELEDWRILPLPESIAENFGTVPYVRFHLSELNGLLCLSIYHDSPNNNKKNIDIWVLKDYGSNFWVNEYNINLSIWTWNWFTGYIVPVWTDDANGKLLIHQQYEQQLYWYDPKLKNVTKFGENNVYKVGVYMETSLSFRIRI